MLDDDWVGGAEIGIAEVAEEGALEYSESVMVRHL